MNILHNYMIPDLCNIVSEYLIGDKAYWKNEMNKVLDDFRCLTRNKGYKHVSEVECYLCNNKKCISYIIKIKDYWTVRKPYLINKSPIPKILAQEHSYVCKSCKSKLPFEHHTLLMYLPLKIRNSFS